MERVAFVVEDTGERIDCLLNPESLEVKRLAGIRSRDLDAPLLIGPDRTDDPVRFTGGGRTELQFDLMFDVAFVEGRTPPGDVRELTGRLWNLCENTARVNGSVRPPLVRLVWGRSWNVPGIVVAIGERFEGFTAGGAPVRSWLRIKLVRVDEPRATAPAEVAPVAVQAQGDGSTGARLDLLAAESLGDPLRWRELADHNGIGDPLAVAPGAVLEVPAGAA